MQYLHKWSFKNYAYLVSLKPGFKDKHIKVNIKAFYLETTELTDISLLRVVMTSFKLSCHLLKSEIRLFD